MVIRMMYNILNINDNSIIIISLSIILFFGFLLTRITKKLRLPNVTGYIISGIIIGPYVLNLIPIEIVKNMGFVTDIALAFIAFDVGKYLRSSAISNNKGQVLIITLFESIGAAIVVTLSMFYIFNLSLSFSILLGAIGAATAPASTIMTIRQYRAKGNFVNTLLQVVALDDAVALIVFSISGAVVQAINSNQRLNTKLFLLPVAYNLIAIGLGLGFGLILNQLINPKRTEDNKLILTIAMILTIAGICSALHVSPLLACMAMGAAYINVSNNENVFKRLNNFTPPILTMFFVLSGMSLNVPSLVKGGVIGVVYFVVRILGKYLGAYIGSSLVKTETEIRKYLGLALIPQAGVSIGLAFLGQRLLPEYLGTMLLTIILSSSVLYEMVGPVSAKAALYLAGSIKAEKRSHDNNPLLSLK